MTIRRPPRGGADAAIDSTKGTARRTWWRRRSARSSRGLAFAIGGLFLPACESTTSQASRAAGAPAAVAQPSRPAPLLHLKRGIDLGNALDAPREGDWGVTLAASDFSAAKRAGFDHVGLPVRFDAHALSTAPYTIDADFLARVDWAIDQALANDLAVVVTWHHYDELMDSPDRHRARFVGIWRKLAEHMRSRPPLLAFEPYAEPSGAMTASQWNEILAEALAVVRASNPTRTVIVEGVYWASARSLRDTLRFPSADPNLVGSFRMFQPILFTHQGAEHMPVEYDTRGIVFPGPPSQPLKPGPGAQSQAWVRDWLTRYNEEPGPRNPCGPAAIANQLDVAADFANGAHLPVYVGAFAAIDNADPKSRQAWTRMTRTEAERRGFGWAYWDDGDKFKVYDRKSGTWDEGLKAALLE